MSDDHDDEREDIDPEAENDDEDEDELAWLDDDEPDFEQQAEECAMWIQEILEEGEIDNATGELVVRIRTHGGTEIFERFQSLEELREFFSYCGHDYEGRELVLYGPLAFDPSDVDHALEEANAAAMFQPSSQGTRMFELPPGILVPATRIELANVNEALVRYLTAHPDSLHRLAPYDFEGLVAEIFRDLGYDVVQTPRSRDGGFDIRAVRKDSVGTLLYLVECKRHARDYPVGVEVVRRLYGVTAAERATCGVLATTSTFTRPAQEYAKKVEYRVSLRDYNDLMQWLQQYPTSRKRK